MTAHRLGATAIASLAVVLLAGCSLLPGGSAPSGAAEELFDSTWAGTDSDGDTWEFTFQEDGTVGLVFNAQSYDDAGDTWQFSGSTLSISLEFDNGPVDFEGPWDGSSERIDLDGTYSGGDFTLTIDRE